ncbi:MAG: hypothetical protein EOO88_62440 [Pedobacter sp.]|nr:MAG: hypothetical protein EOO88_62440 [Pedobacter sp.]
MLYAFILPANIVLDIEPAVGNVIEWFGAERCCLGGDWPVSLLASSYNHSWKQYVEVVERLCTQEEAEQIYSGTATRFYKL